MTTAPRTMFDYVIESCRESVEHMAAHLREGSDTYTDHCHRELVADGCRGLIGQVEIALGMIPESELRHPAEFLGSVPDTEDVEGTSDFEFIMNRIKSDGDDLDYIIGWIESAADMVWEDGDLFRYSADCEVAEGMEDGTGILDVTLRVDPSGDGDTWLMILIAYGGPSARLCRDWRGDYMEVSVWSQTVTVSSDAITEVLDHYAALAN